MAQAAEQADYGISENKDGYVCVRVKVPDLKSKGQGFFSKITGARRDQARNAQIDCNFQSRAVTLMVTVQNTQGNEKRWALPDFHLPHDIDQSASYLETADGFVTLYMKKANTRDDWSAYVRKG